MKTRDQEILKAESNLNVFTKQEYALQLLPDLTNGIANNHCKNALQIFQSKVNHKLELEFQNLNYDVKLTATYQDIIVDSETNCKIQFSLITSELLEKSREPN